MGNEKRGEVLGTERENVGEGFMRGKYRKKQRFCAWGERKQSRLENPGVLVCHLLVD